MYCPVCRDAFITIRTLQDDIALLKRMLDDGRMRETELYAKLEQSLEREREHKHMRKILELEKNNQQNWYKTELDSIKLWLGRELEEKMLEYQSKRVDRINQVVNDTNTELRKISKSEENAMEELKKMKREEIQRLDDSIREKSSMYPPESSSEDEGLNFYEKRDAEQTAIRKKELEASKKKEKEDSLRQQEDRRKELRGTKTESEISEVKPKSGKNQTPTKQVKEPPNQQAPKTISEREEKEEEKPKSRNPLDTLKKKTKPNLTVETTKQEDFDSIPDVLSQNERKPKSIVVTPTQEFKKEPIQEPVEEDLEEIDLETGLSSKSPVSTPTNPVIKASPTSSMLSSRNLSPTSRSPEPGGVYMPSFATPSRRLRTPTRRSPVL